MSVYSIVSRLFAKPIYYAVRVLIKVVTGGIIELPEFERAKSAIQRFTGYGHLRKFLILDEDFSLRYYQNYKGQMLPFPFPDSKPQPTRWLLSRYMPWVEGRLLPQLLVLDGNAINVDGLKFSYSKNLFELPQKVQDMTSAAFREYSSYMANFPSLINFEGRNLRVFDLTIDESEALLKCQPVLYPDYVRTNLCIDYNYGGGRTLRHCVHPDGQIDLLSATPLANNLGINCLLFTVGGKMVVQRRSRDVIVRPGELAPAFSGTVEPYDIEGGRIANMICREGREELGERLFGDRSPHFLGMTRELVRGGEPEMFFFAQISVDECEVQQVWRTARDRREADRLEFYQMGDGDYTKCNMPALKTDILRFIKKNRKTISLPLKTNLALWYRWLDRRAARNP